MSVDNYKKRLSSLKYSELRSLAKKKGVNANQKSGKLVSDLLKEFAASESYASSGEEPDHDDENQHSPKRGKDIRKMTRKTVHDIQHRGTDNGTSSADELNSAEPSAGATQRNVTVSTPLQPLMGERDSFPPKRLSHRRSLQRTGDSSSEDEAEVKQIETLNVSRYTEYVNSNKKSIIATERGQKRNLNRVSPQVSGRKEINVAGQSKSDKDHRSLIRRSPRLELLDEVNRGAMMLTPSANQEVDSDDAAERPGMASASKRKMAILEEIDRRVKETESMKKDEPNENTAGTPRIWFCNEFFGTQKTSSPKKTPGCNFPKSHAKVFEKMEGIGENRDKVKRRHEELTKSLPKTIQHLATPKEVHKASRLAERQAGRVSQATRADGMRGAKIVKPVLKRKEAPNSGFKAQTPKTPQSLQFKFGNYSPSSFNFFSAKQNKPKTPKSDLAGPSGSKSASKFDLGKIKGAETSGATAAKKTRKSKRDSVLNETYEYSPQKEDGLDLNTSFDRFRASESAKWNLTEAVDAVERKETKLIKVAAKTEEKGRKLPQRNQALKNMLASPPKKILVKEKSAPAVLATQKLDRKIQPPKKAPVKKELDMAQQRKTAAKKPPPVQRNAFTSALNVPDRRRPVRATRVAATAGLAVLELVQAPMAKELVRPVPRAQRTPGEKEKPAVDTRAVKTENRRYKPYTGALKPFIDTRGMSAEKALAVKAASPKTMRRMLGREEERATRRLDVMEARRANKDVLLMRARGLIKK